MLLQLLVRTPVTAPYEFGLLSALGFTKVQRASRAQVVTVVGRNRIDKRYQFSPYATHCSAIDACRISRECAVDQMQGTSIHAKAGTSVEKGLVAYE